MIIKTTKTTIVILVISLLGVLSIANVINAQISGIDGGDCATLGLPCNGPGSDSPSSIVWYIWRGINAVLGFSAVLAVAALVYSGVLYVISRGEEDKARQAKTGITFAILGLLVTGFAVWIVNAFINL